VFHRDTEKLGRPPDKEGLVLAKIQNYIE